ncbi:unnamed protein product, partial [Choristocarpus tenellus]
TLPIFAVSNIRSTTIPWPANGAAHGSRASHSNAKGMSSLLEHHYLGMYKTKLGNITCMEMVRPLSKRGLARVSKSIREKGWLEQFAPSVVIQRDCSGNGDQLTADTALAVQGRTLD